MKRITLASASPRRRALLCNLLPDFDVVPSRVVEEEHLFPSPSTTARKLAEMKAEDVATRVTEGIVIGADTLIEIGGEVLGKPRNPEEALKMLHRLAGRDHFVLTGIALREVQSRRVEASVVSTRVQMKAASEAVIREYVATGEPLDKAGAYAIQGLGSALIEGTEGCYNNVVGLPLCEVALLLRKFGVAKMAGLREVCLTPSKEPCARLESIRGREVGT